MEARIPPLPDRMTRIRTRQLVLPRLQRRPRLYGAQVQMPPTAQTFKQLPKAEPPKLDQMTLREETHRFPPRGSARGSETDTSARIVNVPDDAHKRRCA